MAGLQLAIRLTSVAAYVLSTHATAEACAYRPSQFSQSPECRIGASSGSPRKSGGKRRFHMEIKSSNSKNHGTDKEAAKALDGLCPLSLCLQFIAAFFETPNSLLCCDTARLLYKLYQEDGFRFVHSVLQVGLSDEEKAELDGISIAALHVKLKRENLFLVSFSSRSTDIQGAQEWLDLVALTCSCGLLI